MANLDLKTEKMYCFAQILKAYNNGSKSLWIRSRVGIAAVQLRK